MRDTDEVLKKMAQDKKPKSNHSGYSQKNNKKKGVIKASDLRFKLGGVSAVVNFDRLTECLKMTMSKTSKSPCLCLAFKNKEWDMDQDPDKP